MNKAIILKTGRTLSDEYEGKPLAVLADISRSMRFINERGIQRFAEMKDALTKALKGRNDYSLTAFGESLTVVPRPEELTFPAEDATFLGAALEAIRKQKPEHVLIVTDGRPTDHPSDLCIAVLKKHFVWVRVDVLFVGNKNSTEHKFMLQVPQCGGQLFIPDQGTYLEGVQMLLGDGRAI